MKDTQIRNICISIFTAVWLCVFFYESTRYFFLMPVAEKVFGIEKFPKLKFLFPPAGWIMFYQVSDTEGEVAIYGIKEGRAHRLDPHEIYPVRFIGFDNIYRGILGTALYRHLRQPFCRYLHHKIPYFDAFAVSYVYYPSVTTNRYQRYQTLIYRCP